MLQCLWLYITRKGIAKAMLQLFYPDFEVSSAYDIDYDKLYKEGFRGVIFDIDNTLVPHGAPADERAVFLFAKIREIGLDVCLLSNNKERRVSMFCKDLNKSFSKPSGAENGTLVP